MTLEVVCTLPVVLSNWEWLAARELFLRKGAAVGALREGSAALIWRLAGNLCEGEVDKRSTIGACVSERGGRRRRRHREADTTRPVS